MADMDSRGTLTPQGAALLRDVRDYFIAHPERLNLNTFDAGQCFCIAGALNRRLTNAFDSHVPRGGSIMTLVAALGFSNTPPPPDIMGPLFASSTMPLSDHLTVAVARINHFLWQHGYPEHELTAPVPDSELACV